MKYFQILLLTALAMAWTACDSTTSGSKKSGTGSAAVTGSNPNPGTAGGPMTSPRNGSFGAVDPMANGTDGRMPYKNY